MKFKSLAAFVFFLVGSFVSSALAAAPTITSFTPGTGVLRQSVTITGTGFAAPATVTFNGVAATTVTVSSSTSLVASVPNTATTGKIAVTTSGGSVTSTGTFTVNPGVAPALSTATPGSSGPVYFSAFGAFEAVDLYFDTTDFAIASASSAGAGTFTITIPVTATPSTHWITAVGRKSGYSAQVSLTVRTDWPQYGFRPNHRGSNAFENVLSTSNVDGLEESWRTANYGSGYSGAAVVGGLIYTGFTDGSVRAFVESTGAQKWSTTVGSGHYGTPAVANGIVYLGGTDGSLYAFDANTGAVKWSYPSGTAIYSSPTVKGNTVYFASYNGSVYALNATTGDFNWSHPTGAAIDSSPAVNGGLVFIGSNDKNVYALNAANGSVVWTYTTGGEVEASPVVVGGTVYVGSDDDKMYALVAASGVLRWSNTTGGQIYASAAIAHGVVYFGSADAKVYAVAAGSGALLWSFTNPASETIEQTPCVANGVVYTGDLNRVYALDASYGGLLTTVFSGTLLSGPAVVNGALTIPDENDGVLVHFTLDADRATAAVKRPDPATLRHHRLR